MNEKADRGTRCERFRTAIAGFIETRRAAKLKGREDDAGTAAKYDYATWLADAARRVGQIQMVTHVLKATHPDARGSSLYCVPGRLPSHNEIGSHDLGTDYAEDVVGSAAALDVHKFLKIEVEGRRLLDWMQAGDEDLRRALHPEAAVADGWMRAFAGLLRGATAPRSHQAAKQVYWRVEDAPCDNAGYHLLQPLFSSSLAQAVHADIHAARFGEANKLARRAWREHQAHPQGYRDYRNLVARKLGGSKPQNISQLNSERGGINYLLASLPPPGWDGQRFRPLLKTDTAFDHFARFDDVHAWVQRLAERLRADSKPVFETRQQREAIEQTLGARLALFAVSVQASTKPGWSRDPDCALPLCERLWLDPGRLDLAVRSDSDAHTQEDHQFQAEYHRGDWPDQVAGHFARWLNARLRDAGIPQVSDVEYRHWARQAIVDAAWPVPMQRRAPKGAMA